MQEQLHRDSAPPRAWDKSSHCERTCSHGGQCSSTTVRAVGTRQAANSGGSSSGSLPLVADAGATSFGCNTRRAGSDSRLRSASSSALEQPSATTPQPRPLLAAAALSLPQHPRVTPPLTWASQRAAMRWHWFPSTPPTRLISGELCHQL